MTRRWGWLGILGVALGLSACTASRDSGSGWVQDGVTPAQRASDSRACKRQADDDAMRWVHQPDRAAGMGSTVDPMAQVDRDDARRLFRESYAACMRSAGYTARPMN
jgi:hypothetical protein